MITVIGSGASRRMPDAVFAQVIHGWHNLGKATMQQDAAHEKRSEKKGNFLLQKGNADYFSKPVDMIRRRESRNLRSTQVIYYP